MKKLKTAAVPGFFMRIRYAWQPLLVPVRLSTNADARAPAASAGCRVPGLGLQDGHEYERAYASARLQGSPHQLDRLRRSRHPARALRRPGAALDASRFGPPDGGADAPTGPSPDGPRLRVLRRPGRHLRLARDRLDHDPALGARAVAGDLVELAAAGRRRLRMDRLLPVLAVRILTRGPARAAPGGQGDHGGRDVGHLRFRLRPDSGSARPLLPKPARGGHGRGLRSRPVLDGRLSAERAGSQPLDGIWGRLAVADVLLVERRLSILRRAAVGACGHGVAGGAGRSVRLVELGVLPDEGRSLVDRPCDGGAGLRFQCPDVPARGHVRDVPPHGIRRDHDRAHAPAGYDRPWSPARIVTGLPARSRLSDLREEAFRLNRRRSSRVALVAPGPWSSGPLLLRLAGDALPAAPNRGVAAIALALRHRVVQVAEDRGTRLVLRRHHLAGAREGGIGETALRRRWLLCRGGRRAIAGRFCLQGRHRREGGHEKPNGEGS